MDHIDVPWNKSKALELATYVLPNAASWLDAAGVIPTKTPATVQSRQTTLLHLYETLVAQRISYAREPFHVDDREQIIRPAYDVLKGSRRGTCLDLSLMFAGLCLHFDLIPVLIVFSNHAIAAVSLQSAYSDAQRRTPDERRGYDLPGEVLRDKSALIAAVTKGVLLPIECTGFAWDGQSNQLSFTDSQTQGRTVVEQLEFQFAIDLGIAYHDWGLKSRSISSSTIDQLLTFQYQAREVLERVETWINEMAAQPLVGREAELDRLQHLVTHEKRGRVFVKAEAGFGKTSLLAHWIRNCQQHDIPVVYHFFSQDRGGGILGLPDSAYRSVIEQIRALTNQIPAGNYDAALRSTLNQMVREYRRADKPPLVIVLDGLDEVSPEQSFASPFPDELPEGIILIVSARTPAASSATLADWCRNSQEIILKRLSYQAVRQLIQEDASEGVRQFANDAEFLERLEQGIHGFPLYLRYLVEDLREAVDQGQDTINILRNTPTPFAEYVRGQFKQLTETNSKIKRLFTLLTVVLGAIEAQAVAELTDLDEFELATLPTQVSRWFSISEVASGDTFYAFAHPLLAEEFRKLQNISAPPMVNRLTEYCLKTWEGGSVYALRYLIPHLVEQKRYAKVLDLALSSQFRQLQIVLLSDDSLVISTLRNGLLAAKQQSDLGAIVECALRLGYQQESYTSESPLSACRRFDFDRVELLLGQMNQDTAILFALLVANDLLRTGMIEQARRVSERWVDPALLQRPDSRLRQNEDYQDLFLFLLPVVGKLFPHKFTAIVQLLLQPERITTLISDVFPAWIHTNFSITNIQQRVEELVSLLEAPDSMRAELAHQAARAGNAQLAINIAALITDSALRQETFADCTLILVDSNQVQVAEEIVKEYLCSPSIALDGTPWHPEEDFLFKLLMALTKTNQAELASEKAAWLLEQVALREEVAQRWYIENIILAWKHCTGVNEPHQVTLDSISQLIKTFKGKAIQPFLLYDLAKRFQEVGQNVEAHSATHAALEQLSHIDEIDVRIQFRQLLAINLAKLEDKESARQQLQQALEETRAISEDWLSLSLNIAEAISSLQDLDESYCPFSEIRARIDEEVCTKSIKPIFQLTRLAKAQAEAARTQDALRTLADAMSDIDAIDQSKIPHIFNKFFYDKFLSQIALTYTMIGSFSEALEITFRINDASELFRTIGYISKRLGRDNREKDAIDLIGRILIRQKDARQSLLQTGINLLNCLAQTGIASGNPVVSNQAWKGAENLISSYKRPREQYQGLWSIYLQQAVGGQKQDATNGFTSLLEAIEAISDPSIQGIIYRELVETLLEVVSGAHGSFILINTSQSCLEDAKLHQLWKIIVRDLTRELGAHSHEYEDNFKDAIDLIESMEELWHRVDPYLEMVIIYWRVGATDAMVIWLEESLHNLREYEKQTEKLDVPMFIRILLIANWVGKFEWLGDARTINFLSTLDAGNWLLYDHAMYQLSKSNFELATALATAIEKRDLGASVLRQVHSAEMQAGVSPSRFIALKALQELILGECSGIERIACLLNLAIVSAKLGSIADSISTLESAVQAFSKVEQWVNEHPFLAETDNSDFKSLR